MLIFFLILGVIIFIGFYSYYMTIQGEKEIREFNESRPKLTRAEYIEILVNKGYDIKHVEITHDIIQQYSPLDFFSIYPEDDLHKLYGIDDLEDIDIIDSITDKLNLRRVTQKDANIINSDFEYFNAEYILTLMKNIESFKLDTSIKSIVMMGATGAVGKETVKELASFIHLEKLTLLGRTPLNEVSHKAIKQERIDIFNPDSYTSYLEGHHTAICTLGVGQPSKISREDFIKIDKTAVVNFATACKKAGIQHFQLLASVGINSKSSNFYLRAKGELVDELKALNFDRLSIFQPSMILTPKNRYGFSQAVALAVWPLLTPFLQGKLKKYRGIKVDQLGKAIALNTLTKKSGLEFLTWSDFHQF